MSWLAYIIFGLIAGAIAKALRPGADPSGWLVTILIGILGSVVGKFIADKIAMRESNGIALDNVKQRLKAHFGYQVQFRSHTGNGIFTTFVQYRYK